MFFSYKVVLLLVIILLFLCYFKLKVENKIKRLQHQNIIISNLIDTVDDGFYIWDAKKRIEKFSPNLLILLNTVFYSFNEFVDFFEQSESLVKNFTEVKKVNKSFTLDLKSKNGEVYCVCYGRSIIDNYNNVIGVLLWIRNVSDHKIKANELELENIRLKQKVENYRNIFNSLPFPILRYNENKKIKFCNIFYDKYINSSSRLTISDHLEKSKQGKCVITCKNERKVFDFIRIPVPNFDGAIIYGKDVSDAEELRIKLDSYLVAQKNLLEELPIAIAIYSKNQKLKFHNNAFVKTFQFDTKFLASNPTYHEVMLYLFESQKLLEQKDFQAISNQRHELFKKLFGPHNEVIYFTNGKMFRILIIPYASEGLLFSYEECKR